MDPVRSMGSIERYVRFIVESAKNEAGIRFDPDEKGNRSSNNRGKKTNTNPPVNLGKCPLCGGNVLKNRKAYYCSNWKEKECKLTVWISSLERYGQELTDDMMSSMLSGQALTLPLTMPQTAEKGIGEVYISQEGKIEIRNFQKEQ